MEEKKGLVELSLAEMKFILINISSVMSNIKEKKYKTNDNIKDYEMCDKIFDKLADEVTKIYKKS